jgi:hypothetical protein
MNRGTGTDSFGAPDDLVIGSQPSGITGYVSIKTCNFATKGDPKITPY